MTCTCETNCPTCNRTETPQRDGRTVAQRFTETATGGEHFYQVETGFFPPCFTFDEADYYLQRYNAPTYAALRGGGIALNTPGASAGWVVDPILNMAPVGYVTFQRRPGKVVNTTQFPHPFVGTITGEVKNSGGRFYVLFTGQGGKPPADQSFGTTLDEARNYLNTEFGPGVFLGLGQVMIHAAYSDKRRLCGNVPSTFNPERGPAAPEPYAPPPGTWPAGYL